MQGRVLPPGDARAWADALRELASDGSIWRSMVAASRTCARGFAAMAADLEAIYRQAAVASHARSVPRRS